MGWTNWEEINTGRGVNFGWPLYEGGNGVSLRTEALADKPELQELYDSASEVTAPIYALRRSDGYDGAITVGDFYTGTTYPELYQEALFFANVSYVYALLFDAQGNVDSVTPFSDDNTRSYITQVSMGPDSNLYFSDLGAGEIGRWVFEADVTVDDAPVVKNAIADVTVDEDADNTVIDLSNVFTDVDNDDSGISLAVSNNPNESLVTATIDGNNLTLDYQDNQWGTAEITIQATSNDKSVEETFTVKVNPVNDDQLVLIRETNNAIDGMAYDTNPANNNNISTKLRDDLLNLGIEAVFDNLVGFYEIVDMNGGIDTDEDGVDDLMPGDSGYARAAIVNRIANWELRAGSSGDPSKNTTTEQFGDVIIAGGKMYAPFVIANAGEIGFEGFVAAEDGETDGEFNEAATNIDDMVAYFAFIGANPDGVVHLEARGNNTFGFEDLPANLGVSDNDFDDAIFEFDFSFV